jgi:hypothetical protein
MQKKTLLITAAGSTAGGRWNEALPPFSTAGGRCRWAALAHSPIETAVGSRPLKNGGRPLPPVAPLSSLFSFVIARAYALRVTYFLHFFLSSESIFKILEIVINIRNSVEILGNSLILVYVRNCGK